MPLARVVDRGADVCRHPLGGRRGGADRGAHPVAAALQQRRQGGPEQCVGRGVVLVHAAAGQTRPFGHGRRGEATDSLVAQHISGGCHDLGPAHDVVFGDGRSLDARHTGSVSTATRRTSFSTAVSVNCRHDLSARSRDPTPPAVTPAGASSATTTPSAPGAGGPWRTIALATALIIMDATIVNVALPVVIRDLDLTASQAEWMNAVYSLVFAALLLTMGHLGDLRGRRVILGLGMLVFMGASILAASAQGAFMLIGARLLQGVGASMILTCALSAMNSIFRGRERGIAFAVYGSTIGGMAAVGPLLGGWLATDVSWRWAFWLNIPVGLLVLLGIWRVLPETRDPGAEPHFDLPGAGLSAIGMGGLVFALIEGASYGWWRQGDGSISPVPIAAAAAAVATVLFFRREARGRARGIPTMVDLALLRLPTLRYGLIAAAIVAFGEFGLMFTLPLLLQGTLGYSPLGAGWLLVSLAVGAFLVSGMTHQLTLKLGQRAVVRIGLVLGGDRGRVGSR